jgi:hypothetical protein
MTLVKSPPGGCSAQGQHSRRPTCPQPQAMGRGCHPPPTQTPKTGNASQDQTEPNFGRTSAKQVHTVGFSKARKMLKQTKFKQKTTLYLAQEVIILICRYQLLAIFLIESRMARRIFE